MSTSAGISTRSEVLQITHIILRSKLAYKPAEHRLTLALCEGVENALDSEALQIWNIGIDMNNVALMKHSRSFVASFPWVAPQAITLTFKLGKYHNGVFITPGAIEYSQNVRHFLNLLNKALFGALARNGWLLSVVSVLEHPPGGRPHYHLVVDKPAHIPNGYFEWLVQDLWRQTFWGHRVVHVGVNGGLRWINYVTKLRTKPNYDESIDWHNTHNVAPPSSLPFKIRMKRSIRYISDRCRQAILTSKT